MSEQTYPSYTEFIEWQEGVLNRPDTFDIKGVVTILDGDESDPEPMDQDAYARFLGCLEDADSGALVLAYSTEDGTQYRQYLVKEAPPKEPEMPLGIPEMIELLKEIRDSLKMMEKFYEPYAKPDGFISGSDK